MNLETKHMVSKLKARVEFESLLTGYKGHGEWLDYEAAVAAAEYANEKYKYEAVHRVVIRQTESIKKNNQ